MNTVTIKINGIEYNLKGRENEEYLLEVAKYVDGKVKDIMANNRKLSSTAAATLVALNIADELFKADIEIEVLMKKNTSLDERNLTLKERIKEIREEAEGIEFNTSREINKLNEIIDELNKKLLEAEELKNKVTLLENENEENNLLREKISKLEKEISAKEVDINEKDSLKLEIDSLKNENLTLREEVENCYKEVENLKETNDLLKNNEVGYKEKFIKLNEECKIMEDDFKKTKAEKDLLKQRNKEIKFQLQNSKYKVL
ncbi:cell division protein ZapA, partial [Clostridium tertium]|uniref:cell division protein ZapA n=2 Tax=Clostridiaceae TaxID=31979 RepID=UPI00325C09F9